MFLIPFSPGAVTMENALMLLSSLHIRKPKLKKEKLFAQVTQPAIDPAE